VPEPAGSGPAPSSTRSQVPRDVELGAGAAAGAAAAMVALDVAFRRALNLLLARLIVTVAFAWRYRIKGARGSGRSWVAVMARIIASFRGQSADLAAGYVAALHEVATGAPLDHALIHVPPPVSARQLAITFNWAGPGQAQAKFDKALSEAQAAVDKLPQSTVNSLVAEADRSVGKAAEGAAVRLVMDAVRETITETTKRDGKSRGWARVSDGKPCYFCAMLISRGPVYHSREVAAYADGIPGNPYHDHCACYSVPVYGMGFKVGWTPEAVEYDKLWAMATRGYSGAEARNAFRRALKAMQEAKPPAGKAT